MSAYSLTIHHTSEYCRLRKEYLEICGDKISALILDCLEYWSNCKAKKTAESADLWLHERIENFINLIGASRQTVAKALRKLVSMNLVEIRNSSRSKWDRAREYRLCISAIQQRINNVQSKTKQTEQKTMQPVESTNTGITTNQNEQLPTPAPTTPTPAPTVPVPAAVQAPIKKYDPWLGMGPKRMARTIPDGPWMDEINTGDRTVKRVNKGFISYMVSKWKTAPRDERNASSSFYLMQDEEVACAVMSYFRKCGEEQLETEWEAYCAVAYRQAKTACNVASQLGKELPADTQEKIKRNAKAIAHAAMMDEQDWNIPVAPSIFDANPTQLPTQLPTQIESPRSLPPEPITLDVPVVKEIPNVSDELPTLSDELPTPSEEQTSQAITTLEVLPTTSQIKQANPQQEADLRNAIPEAFSPEALNNMAKIRELIQKKIKTVPKAAPVPDSASPKSLSQAREWLQDPALREAAVNWAKRNEFDVIRDENGRAYDIEVNLGF